MLTMYGIPNCDTVRKARRWLTAHNIDFQFHDFRKDGLTEADIAAWLAHTNWEPLLNKRGTTWRKLEPNQQADLDQAKAIALMVEFPALIKRPVMLAPNLFLLGFKEADWATALAKP